MNQEQIQQEAHKRYPDTDSSLTNGLAKVQRVAFEKGSEFVNDRHAWVSVSERLPTKEDANKDDKVDALWKGRDGRWKMERVSLRYFTPTSYDYFRRPLDNNFPKTESNG